MKAFLILIILIIFVVVATLNVDASGLTALYQQGVSEAVNLILYVTGLVGLVALRRKILK